MELEEKINQITQDKFNFKLKSAVLDSASNVCSLEFLYDDGTLLNQQIISQICDQINSFMPQGYIYQTKFTKNFVASESIMSAISQFFGGHSSIAYKILDIKKSNDCFAIKIQFATEQQDYIVAKKIVYNIEEFLQEKFSQKFVINASYASGLIDLSASDDDQGLPIETQKYLVCTNITPIFGDKITENATYIKNSLILDKQVVVCGYIKDFRENFTKPKIKEGQNAEQLTEYFKNPNVPLAERLEAGQRRYYKFKIEDFTGEINCIIFPKEADAPKFSQIYSDMPAIIKGTVKQDKFFGIILSPQSICACELPQVWEEQIDYKKEQKNYEYVFPEEMLSSSQVGLFSGSDKQTCEFLRSHDVVVFDFETTGLSVSAGDKIIELGAVKIINGQIAQKFYSRIDPERLIPPDSSRIHHITDRDVIGKPKAGQVLQDFYKFTRGAVLCGYNVGFDLGFLKKEGRDNQYNFDNPWIDCLALTQKFVKGVKNYKLGTIAKKYNVLLDNAHNALADTIATAELFIMFADHIDSQTLQII